MPSLKKAQLNRHQQCSRPTFIDYMKKYLFNVEKGDGEIVVAYDGRTRTMHIIGVHNTNLGPGLGGLREKDYSTFDSMLTDALRLSRSMTYKAAVSGTETGGGKATRTIPKGIRKEANLSVGRICNFINIKRAERNVQPYVTAEDSNTTNTDMDEIFEICENVACKSLHVGGSGNPYYGLASSTIWPRSSHNSLTWTRAVLSKLPTFLLLRVLNLAINESRLSAFHVAILS